jgi:hypothetical protein
MLHLQSEGHGLKNMGLRLSLTRHKQTVADQSHGLSMTPVSIEQLRATLRQESIRSKSSQRQNWMAVQNTMVQKQSPANMKIVISCLQPMKKRMEYTL